MNATPQPTIRIGLIGTSWWADAMYLPALSSLSDVAVTAIAGRRPGPLAERASQWDIAATYADWRDMLDRADLDGVIIAAANSVHHPAALAALRRDLAVLCEKPLAGTAGEAHELAELADQRQAVTMVPFTYAFMPGFRWLRRLVREGYVGRVHHVGLRYHTGFGLDPAYNWKFDARRNPTGALGDIGSHFIHLAIELAGPISHVTAQMDTLGSRATTDPDGQSYPAASDAAILILGFEGGAQGVLHASAVAHEGTSMDQRHMIEVHGSAGTLAYKIDWDEVQIVTGSRVGEGPVRPLPIPDDIWGPVRRSPIHDTYRDVFRTTDAMARGWAQAIAPRRQVRPDFADGAAVQQVLEAALASSTSGRRVALDPPAGERPSARPRTGSPEMEPK
ncbi:Gfo/Idh/MocA family protein [Euzebya tangerina]|uniref:Gfo/Idh/MocA family protein n=1 Tax=Euzebya tangerina TaxID=591198 RepID=UPI000E31CAC6|nr:Gfo/Idh/MocA family oxidoreductase [Euzebya tangerina]